MLDFTAFEASFNGSQQKFPIFNRNSPSLHIFRFPLARKGRSGRRTRKRLSRGSRSDPAPCWARCSPSLNVGSSAHSAAEPPPKHWPTGEVWSLWFSSINTLPLSPSVLEKRVKKAVRARRRLGTRIVCFRSIVSFSWSLRKANFLVVPPPRCVHDAGQTPPRTPAWNQGRILHPTSSTENTGLKCYWGPPKQNR